VWYVPYLRVRHAVLVYACIAVGLSLVAVALRYWPGAVQMDHHDAMPDVTIAMLIAGSAALVGGLATVLGLNLAAENDGHLEVAWTKPITREGYALGVFAVDIVAMAACVILTAVCGAVIADVYAGGQVVRLGFAHDLAGSLETCGLPLLVYGWIAAATASLKRNRGAIAGIFWPAMLVCATLPHVPVAPIAAFGPVFGALNLLKPITLFSVSKAAPSPSLFGPELWAWLIAAALLAAAIVQWRRLQL
jgi:hypothetical protein